MRHPAARLRHRREPGPGGRPGGGARRRTARRLHRRPLLRRRHAATGPHQREPGPPLPGPPDPLAGDPGPPGCAFPQAGALGRQPSGHLPPGAGGDRPLGRTAVGGGRAALLRPPDPGPARADHEPGGRPRAPGRGPAPVPRLRRRALLGPDPLPAPTTPG
ncbi:hypothetical protein B7486_69670 [cyanobacterium TDX16]|nr:hypothetical protein B7486_69670 [cyanobacterium TDX16]